MSEDYFKKGDWNANCDSCGISFKASELKKRWDGMFVCKDDFEVRHPLDFIRAKEEHMHVPWTRPDDTVDQYTTYTTSQVLSASHSSLLFHFDTTAGGVTATLPTANNASFNGVSVVYVINNDGTANSVTVASSSTIIGSTTVGATSSGKYTNVPASNYWRRI